MSADEPSMTYIVPSGPIDYKGDEDEYIFHNVSGVYKWLETRPTERRRAPGDRGQPLWNPEVMKEVVNLSTRLERGTLNPGDTYEVKRLDSNRKPIKFTVPHYNEAAHLRIRLVGYQALSQNLDGQENFITNDDHRVVPYYVEATDPSRHRRNAECKVKEGEGGPWAEWKEDWKTSAWSKRLQAGIRVHAEEMKRVDKILCFALGSLQTEIRILNSDEKIVMHKKFPKRFIQHMAACTVRETILELRKGSSSVEGKKGESAKGSSKGTSKGKERMVEVPDIKIIAQDPDYCETCKEVLKKELEIEATTSYEPLASVTKNTFVICINPSADILGVICDLTRDFGGPLAMMCNEIEDDEKYWHGQPIPGKASWLKWDEWDGISVSSNNESGRQWDQSTKNMVEYKRRCYPIHSSINKKSPLDLDDFQEHTGISHKQFHGEYRTQPVVAEIHRRYRELQEEGGKSGVDLEKKYKLKYGTTMRRDKKSSMRIYKGHGLSNFAGIRLYVKEESAVSSGGR